MGLLAFTAEEINGFISAIGNILTVLTTIIVGYLLKRQATRVEKKTDAQTQILKQQDATLEEHGSVLTSIKKSEDQR